MYSQNDEEKIILDYFGDKFGRFYDIGAWDGKTFSNTRALLEKGWTGVMVEPSPAAFVGLLKNCAEFGDKVRLVNAAITPKPSLMEFYDAGGDATGSLNPDHAKSWGHGKIKFTVHTLAAPTLFSSFGPAEFINLDVESINAILFQHLPFDWPDLKLICVEHDGYEAQMEELAKPAGFKRIHRTGENLILAR
jgi:FkbM family methyltransferase